MTTPDPQQLARDEWRLLTLETAPNTPAQAVATVRAVTGDTSEAVYLLFVAACEVLHLGVSTAQRHPDSAPIWERCADLCESLRAQLLGVAFATLTDVREQAQRLPQHADGTCARNERYALLAWCARVERELTILEAVEQEEASQ